MTTSDDWRGYFERNAQIPSRIPWELGADLTDDERCAIASSVQEFQAGESSEGRHLYRFAQEYAARTGDYEYLRALRLFIGEEQRHALHLGRFLTINGIPLVDSTFADQVFRRLRNVVSSLEVSIAVLLTAELIAKVYYAVLREATQSAILRALCERILSDEQAHVHFQSGQLAILRARRTTIVLAATFVAHRVLYAGTVVVVWWSHRHVIRRAGLRPSQWWNRCWAEFSDALGGPALTPLPATSRTRVVGDRANAHRTPVRQHN